MEKENLKSVYSKRFRYSNEKPEMKASEAIFLVLATLVEIGYPLYFWLSDYKMRFPYNIIFMLGTILAFFLIFMDLKTFFQSNYVDLLYFQVRTYIVLMLISLVVCWLYRYRLAEIFEFEGNQYTVGLITVLYYVIYLMGSLLCIAVTDFVFAMILMVLASILRIDTQNPYLEKLQSAQTIEGSEEYTRRRIRSEFENRFQESSIDEASFAQYFNEQHKNESVKLEAGLDKQGCLFEHTKHFKMITNMNQVDSRYEMLMKIYMPQNGSDYVPEICKEIQKEYKEIKGNKKR